jgi:phosphate/sulfate permease
MGHHPQHAHGLVLTLPAAIMLSATLYWAFSQVL